MLAELKRRNVTRAAVLYAGAAWVLAQGVASLAPALGFPEWTTRAFVIAVAIGFPFWVAMAWFYELTPEGLRRESEVPAEESITRQTGRRLNYWIVGVLSLAVVLLLTDKLLLRKPPAEAAPVPVAEAAAAEVPVPAASIAVLPLANTSGDPAQAFFADGLTEELIVGLSRIDGLKVVGRSSSARFRDSTESSASIGGQLGVAHLLEGSVRRQGNQVRIGVNLLAADDGRSLWSQVFERELTDIFEVQDQVARAVATALRVQLGDADWLLDEWPSNGDVEAYLLYLEARSLHRSSRVEDLDPSIKLLRQAVARDPGYAAAWALLAMCESNRASLRRFDDLPLSERSASASLEAMQRALAIAPESPPVMIVHSEIAARRHDDIEQAFAITARAYALYPEHPLAMNSAKRALYAQGRFEEMLEISTRLLEFDPMRVHFLSEHAAGLAMVGQLDDAARLLQRALALEPELLGAHASLSLIEVLRGNLDEAMALSGREVFPLLQLTSRGAVEAARGERERALATAAEVGLACRGACAIFLIETHALLGDTEAIYAAIERSVEDGGTGLLGSLLLRGFWHESRFRELALRNGTPVPAGAAELSLFEPPVAAAP